LLQTPYHLGEPPAYPRQRLSDTLKKATALASRLPPRKPYQLSLLEYLKRRQLVRKGIP
jgi:hypothetical protein